ncbi:hypothetical protein ACJ72_06879 [Emergomyces africanus]|uniref:C2H2-type domain-containing protein n=1 Tax=Emergomyces africanus TaxID=1955775 RepID=A0A1B7NPU8_9EURO|nr:hypothetical protein ACJ72_06879 [Emergomyces africanus]
MDRPASDYAQPGLHPPNPTLAEPQSERPAAEQTAAAASGQYTSQPEARPATQYTTQAEGRSSNISSSNTPQPDYGLNPPAPAPPQPQPPPPPAARPPPGPYPEYLTRQPQYHHAPHTQPGGAAGMAQATSPSMPLQDGQQSDHRTPSSNKSDTAIPIDPSIAASSLHILPRTPPITPRATIWLNIRVTPLHRCMAVQTGRHINMDSIHMDCQGHIAPLEQRWVLRLQLRPQALVQDSQDQSISSDSFLPTQTHSLSQVYSFVPIPGAQQHKRPRRRYEEIERMYKCGWNGCEKAYGTLNHLNAHVTMQSHGAKRTPEEFKEIRKEWKARKKEEENQRKAAEERERAAAQANQVDGNVPADPSQSGQPTSYPTGGRPQLPPIGYQPADGQVPGQYGASAGAGLVYPPSNGQMAAPYPPANYPHSPYGQGNQVYQPRE